MAELGQQLREAREARGLSIEAVATGTRIRAAYIKALEEERFADLPAPVYVRGFLRNYATFLGLDAEEVIGALEHQQNGEFQAQRRPARQQVAAPVWRGPSPRALTGAVLLIILVGFVAYLFRQYSEFTASRSTDVFAAAPSATPVTLPGTVVPIPTVTPIPTLPPSPTAIPAATPVRSATRSRATGNPSRARPAVAAPTSTAKPTPTQVAPLVLSLRVLSDCWLLVTVDGKVTFEGTLQAGAARAWDGKKFITVRYGNAGGVDATFNGKAEGIVGRPGQVVERTYRLG